MSICTTLDLCSSSSREKNQTQLRFDSDRIEREELGLELDGGADAPLMVTISETVGITAGHTDVSLWYVVNADRCDGLEFDAEEFHGVQWFHFSEAPVCRSDPHLRRFLGKLALTGRSTRSRAKARAAER